MTADLPPLPTIGAIAQRFGVSAERVGRAIRALGIEPVARAGTARVYSLQAVDRLRRELSEEVPAR